MNLLKALATVSSFTLLSRITGFVRDAIIARVFGAGMLTDAFFVAFRIPNLLRRLFAEGAFSQAFVPVLAQQRTKQGDQAARELIDQVASRLAASLLITCVIGVLAAPLIVYVSAPGFSTRPEKFALTAELLRITFPYILFISLTALASGVLNTWGNFWVPAFTPVLLNVSFIVFSLWLSSYFDRPVVALAWAVVVGGVAQLGFQLYFLWRRGLFPRLNWQPLQAAGKRILKLMGPAVFGVSVAQISLLINTIFASFLVTGSVSWLYYADRLMEFPSGLLGVALSTILLPSLARAYTSGAKQNYSKLLDWGLRLTFLLTLPAAVALAILAVPLISTLFYHGAFTAEDLWQTRKALVAYSVGLIGIILVKILAPGFYAKQDIKTPVKIAVTTLVATQIMNLIFINELRHAGLALAIGLGACLNAALLFRGLRRDGIYHPEPGWQRFFVKVGIALAVMAALLWWAASAHGVWLEAPFWQRAAHLSWVVALGAGAYFATLWLLGFRVRDFVMRAAG